MTRQGAPGRTAPSPPNEPSRSVVAAPAPASPAAGASADPGLLADGLPPPPPPPPEPMPLPRRPDSGSSARLPVGAPLRESPPSPAGSAALLASAAGPASWLRQGAGHPHTPPQQQQQQQQGRVQQPLAATPAPRRTPPRRSPPSRAAAADAASGEDLLAEISRLTAEIRSGSPPGGSPLAAPAPPGAAAAPVADGVAATSPDSRGGLDDQGRSALASASDKRPSHPAAVDARAALSMTGGGASDATLVPAPVQAAGDAGAAASALAPAGADTHAELLRRMDALIRLADPSGSAASGPSGTAWL